jgi:hypothetical protein
MSDTENDQPDEPTHVRFTNDVTAYRFVHDTETGRTETYTYGSAQPPERLERTDGKPPFIDSQRRTLDAFAAKLRQEWRHLPATDRRLDTAQRMTGILADDLLDYLLGLKEPDLAHLILLSDYCGCHAVDLWPTRKEVRG